MADKDQAFELAYKKHFGWMLKEAALKAGDDAEDVVVEVLAKLWEIWDTLDNTDHLKALLTTMVRNKCIDRSRRSKAFDARFGQTETLEGVAGIASPDPDPPAGWWHLLPEYTQKYLTEHYPGCRIWIPKRTQDYVVEKGYLALQVLHDPDLRNGTKTRKEIARKFGVDESEVRRILKRGWIGNRFIDSRFYPKVYPPKGAAVEEMPVWLDMHLVETATRHGKLGRMIYIPKTAKV